MVEAIRWDAGRRVLRLLDQRLLPGAAVWIECADAAAAAEAIRVMVVRGAPAIGITAAYGLAAEFARNPAAGEKALEAFRAAARVLRASLPTAVNLRFALERMGARLEGLRAASAAEVVRGLGDEADRIFAEDLAANRRIGALGAELLPATDGPARILTHCNAGALATSGYGTALGIVRAAAGSGRPVEVFSPETRPYLQGARLTAWEMVEEGIPVTLITDGMVGSLFRVRGVDAVVVGADRIAANGDAANKVGTYQAAVLAAEHGVPFVVAAPFSTVDLRAPTGRDIPIEERGREEVTEFAGNPVAPEGVAVWNPAFDITPARFISAIVTERGIARAPHGEALARMGGKSPAGSSAVAAD